MKIELPHEVSEIIQRLEQAGFEAYAVGGCVRDTILGRAPQDWDITTSATPMQIKKLFLRTIDTGIAHGTVTVMKNHVGYEVTTYRIDGEYKDCRHPSSVAFTDNLLLDLERRDFTINAMAYNERCGLVDAFDGMGDIKRKIIRCVGDAGERFDEDALRMLRAVRFSGQLGFSIDEATRQAICGKAEHLRAISAERIRVELSKLLVSQDAGKLREAYETGMTAVFLPEFDRMMPLEQKNPHHIATVGEHSIRSVEAMNAILDGKKEILPLPLVEAADNITKKQRLMLCVTMLLHDVGKPDTMQTDEQGIGHFHGHAQAGQKIARSILKRLTFDNETVDTVKHLIYWHDYRFENSERAMRRAMAKIGAERMPLLFFVQYSDILAQNPTTWEEKLKRLEQAVRQYENVLASEAALCLKDLAVSGRDVMELGVAAGPQIGKILKNVLEYVIENPKKNEREILLDYIRENLQESGGM